MKLKAVTMEKSPCPKDAIKRRQLSSLLMSSYIKMGNCCLFLKLLLPGALKLACVLTSENYDSQGLRDFCFKKATILKEKNKSEDPLRPSCWSESTETYATTRLERK